MTFLRWTKYFVGALQLDFPSAYIFETSHLKSNSHSHELCSFRKASLSVQDVAGIHRMLKCPPSPVKAIYTTFNATNHFPAACIPQALLTKSRPASSTSCGLVALELVDYYSHTRCKSSNIWTFIVQLVPDHMIEPWIF